jgi:hypothetical protein
MPASSHHDRDADGRLRGLAKVESWQKSNNGRKGARLSPWRFGAVRYSPRPTTTHTRK